MDYLDETKEQDRLIIDNFEKYYLDRFMKEGYSTEAEENLLFEYLSADKREGHRQKRKSH